MMQRNLRRILVLLFLLVSFLGLRFVAATACVLLPLPTVLDANSEYDPKKSKLLTTLIVNLEHGESLRGLKIFVTSTARSSSR